MGPCRENSREGDGWEAGRKAERTGEAGRQVGR